MPLAFMGKDTITPMSYTFGYARVSTTDQNALMQHDALTAAGCDRIFTDTSSGAVASRPELNKLMDQIRPGDTLVVWRLDRLGRSMKDLIEWMESLGERGIDFRSLQESIDTTTSGGKLTFHLFASMAQFERDLISERTKAGLEAARARGRVGGRKPSLSKEKAQTALRLYEAKELTVQEIAEVLGVSRSTIYRALAQQT